MSQYRTSRNIEASLVDYLQTEIDKAWTGVNVIIGFEDAYSQDMPIVALFLQNTRYDPIEIGNYDLKRDAAINLNIFATGDGQRLDLKDYIIKKLFPGCIYYKYTILSGVVSAKVANGRIDINDITDTHISFDDLGTVDAHDKHRHQISFRVTLTQYEED